MTPGKVIIGQFRDYLDVAALADRYGAEEAARTLADIDRYYADEIRDGVPGATQVARQLAAPRPADKRTLQTLASYKGLDPRWQDWKAVTEICRAVAARMLDDENRGAQS